MTFGKNLKKLRQQNNISQGQLAQELNVKQYVVSSWEIERSEPSIEQINFLATYFQVPTDFLLGREVIMINNGNEFESITTELKEEIKDEIAVTETLQEDDISSKENIAQVSDNNDQTDFDLPDMSEEEIPDFLKDEEVERF